MRKNSIIAEINQISSKLPHMTKAEAEVSVQRLHILGVEIPEEPRQRPGILCPYTDTQLVTACCLDKCPYSIENHWARNCLLEYLDSQHKDSLEVDEIAFLLHIDPLKVQAVIDKGMLQLRENSEETVGISGDFLRKGDPVYEPNLGVDDSFTVTRLMVAPPFMRDVNDALDKGVTLEETFRHPAIRLLGVLDQIINELE